MTNSADIKSTYDFLRKNSLEQVKSMDLSQIKESNNAKDVQQVLPVMHKVANSCSIEDWGEFMTKNEIPAIKLTSSEMETLKGGHIIVELVVYAIKWAIKLGSH